ncbi:uncharacterized protein [Penaeus vannamei]|uniref:uncharacterized protein n=1 Tax=Penaeus vannamei TaxID=6689 RepID=UPI00387FA7D7
MATPVPRASGPFPTRIYNFGSLTIVLNTILCFIATKRLWARMLLCEQLKIHYAPEDIAEAHNIVIELSDARRPRLTTRDTKRMINVTVHTMLDDLVDNKNIIASTTEVPSDKIPPVKKQEISTPFTKIFTKTKSEGTQTHTVPADPTSGNSLNVLQNKVDVLMVMFMKQQATLNSLFENEEGMPWRSPARKSAPRPPPPPGNATTNPVPPEPDVITGQCYAALQARDPADASEPRIPPRPARRQNPPSRPPHSSATEKMSNKETQVTPTRNNTRNSKSRNKRNNRRENDKPENTVPPPPTALNREWSDAKYHHVPGVPQPDSSNTAPVVINNNDSHNHVRHETSNPSNVDADGFTLVEKRKEKKEDKIEQRSINKPLQGAAKPEVYLYITNCHTDTEKADIENHLLVHQVTTLKHHGSLRPTWLPREISVLVICGIYFPPRAPTEESLRKHIIGNVFILQAKYGNPFFVILGDLNTFSDYEITSVLNFKLVVSFATCGKNILDKIITNKEHFYERPTSLPPLGNSDHLSLLWVPKKYQAPTQLKGTKLIRRFPDFKIREFRSWITHHDWADVLNAPDSNTKCQLFFYKSVWNQVDNCFPLKRTSTHHQDRPWVTNRIKDLILARQKAYKTKNIDATKYLAKKVRQEIRWAKKNYHKQIIDKISDANPKSWYSHIRNLIGDKRSDSYLSHISEIADSTESAVNIINCHFANINKLLPPLQSAELPTYLTSRPLQAIVSEYDVYQHLRRIAKSKSPDDILPRLLREFAPELATPLCDIFNCSITEGVVPDLWKRAITVPIPKTSPPNSLDGLMPISLTPIPCKILERIIAKELWKIFAHKLDHRQFGNTKDRSTVHYLVDLINYITSNVDKILEVTTVTIDLRKALDLIDHTTLVKKMISMGFHKGWVKWISSFINLRSLRTRANNQISDEIDLHCGVPQVTVLDPLLFLIMVHDKIPHVKIYKYVDDMTLALTHQPGFKFNKLADSGSTLKIGEELVTRAKEVNLLGTVFSDDLKWFANTKLKSFGASQEDLLRIWTTLLRPVCEYAAPVWHSSITNFEKIKLEKLQKRALHIILGSNYTTYTEALNQLQIPSLEDRRKSLTKKFAHIFTSTRHRHLLPDASILNHEDVNNKLCEPKCHTSRYYMSTIPYCIRHLNDNFVK